MNPFRRRWVFSIKSDSAYGRSRAYWEGSDLYRDSHWLGIDSIPYGTPYGNASDTPVPWLNADVGDPPLVSGGRSFEFFRRELYNADAVSYESLQLGLFTILQCKHGDNPRCPGPENGHEYNSVSHRFGNKRSQVPAMIVRTGLPCLQPRRLPLLARTDASQALGRAQPQRLRYVFGVQRLEFRGQPECWRRLGRARRRAAVVRLRAVSGDGAVPDRRLHAA